MEKSESGAPIYRYDSNSKKGFESPTGDPSIDEISDHIEQYVGKIDSVYHELVSDKVHIDIHIVKPTDERPFYTLVTSGMSDLPMNAPTDLADVAHAELLVCLPPDWKLAQEDLEDENNYWPIRWLKILSRFPHEYNTWLGWGHTIPNGDPAQPYVEGTELNTILLLPSIMFGEDFRQLKLENKVINFFALVPLYTEEVELKMKSGVESLFDGFDAYGVTDILDLKRINTAKN